MVGGRKLAEPRTELGRLADSGLKGNERQLLVEAAVRRWPRDRPELVVSRRLISVPANGSYCHRPCWNLPVSKRLNFGP